MFDMATAYKDFGQKKHLNDCGNFVKNDIFARSAKKTKYI